MGITATTGLISGINFGELTQQIIAIERRPLSILEERRTSLQTVSAEFSQLSIQLSNLRAQASAAAEIASFNPNTVSVTQSSTGLDLLSATVTAQASEGQHQITVNQLATAHALAAQGFVDDDTTSVASTTGTFSFTVGGGGKTTSVTVDSNTTLAELREKINAAKGDVTASILNDGSGSNPYRLILTGTQPGLAKTISVTNNPTTLDFTNKKIEAAFAATTNSFSGTVSSNEGTGYTGTTNKSFLVKIVSAGTAGVATYKYSIDGGITFLGANGAVFTGTNAIATQGTLTNYIDGAATANATNDGVQSAFGVGTLAVDDTFTVDVFNPLLQDAKDAVVTIGNLTLQKSSNTITDAIEGVTLNLLKAVSSETINIKIQKDNSEITTTVEQFIATYNDIISLLRDQLTFDPELETPKPLQGETTAILIERRLKNLVTGIVPGANPSFASLSTIGIASNKDTGLLSLNQTQLSTALKGNVQDVTRLFAAIGVTSSTSVDFVSKSFNSQPGTYPINITAVPTRATVTGGTTVPAAGITVSETLAVSLFSNATSSSDPPTAVSVILPAGSKASAIVNLLNGAFSSAGMSLSATKTSGNNIELTASNYGDDYKIIVFSTADAANQSGIGKTPLSAQGIDIAGRVNNHPASGAGEFLTGSTGFPESGIRLKAPVTSTGVFGSVTISSGVAGRMVNFLDAVTSLGGSINTRVSGIGEEIGRINRDLARKEAALIRKELVLAKQFSRLETLLGQFATQSQIVANSLASLQNLSTLISRAR